MAIKLREDQMMLVERVPALGSSKEVDLEECLKKEKAYRKRVRNLGK